MVDKKNIGGAGNAPQAKIFGIFFTISLISKFMNCSILV